jgi:hypothetical protein
MFTRLYWKKASHVRKVLIEAGFSEDKVDILKQEVYLDFEDWERWSQIAWTLAGRPAERWEEATTMLREGVRRSTSFQSSEGGSSHIRCVINSAITRK